MNNRVLLSIVALVFVLGSVAAFTWRTTQSVCTMTGLTGPALQENDAYCANGTNIAPSTYAAAIALAQAKAIVVGTPERVYTCHDWRGVRRVCVDFSHGFQAQHYLYNPLGIPPWIYDSCSNEVWPLWIISRPC